MTDKRLLDVGWHCALWVHDWRAGRYTAEQRDRSMLNTLRILLDDH